ncbi:hypothetical protein Hte_009861 [Hypoxylon texense]
MLSTSLLVRVQGIDTGEALRPSAISKGVADEELAKIEAERAKKRSLDEDDSDGASPKRARSSSYDSVSSISTRRSLSPPPQAQQSSAALPEGPGRGRRGGQDRPLEKSVLYEAGVAQEMSRQIKNPPAAAVGDILQVLVDRHPGANGATSAPGHETNPRGATEVLQDSTIGEQIGNQRLLGEAAAEGKRHPLGRSNEGNEV